MNSDTFIGPLARKSCQDRIMEQVNQGLAADAYCYQADMADSLSDCFFPATLIELFSKENNLWQDEVFGPVFSRL